MKNHDNDESNEFCFPSLKDEYDLKKVLVRYTYNQYHELLTFISDIDLINIVKLQMIRLKKRKGFEVRTSKGLDKLKTMD